MERGVFPEPEVSGELKKTVEARLHTDRYSSKHYARMAELQKKLAGVKTLPVYLLLDPKTEKVLSRMEGARGRGPFLEFLAKGMDTQGN